jgi:hypothetical protein
MSKRSIRELSLKEIEKISQKAVHQAISKSIAMGLPITGKYDGKVQTLMPDDPRLDAFRLPWVSEN